MLIALTILNVVLIAYLFLLSLRIVLGWFAPQALGKAWDLLCSVTDPYLDLFGRIRFLRGGLFDFSPIAAVLALVVALDLVNQLLYYGRITLGFFLASVLSAAWSGARFLLLLFLIIGILRTIPHALSGLLGGRDLEGGRHHHEPGRGLRDQAFPLPGPGGLHAAPPVHHRAPVRRLALRRAPPHSEDRRAVPEASHLSGTAPARGLACSLES